MAMKPRKTPARNANKKTEEMGGRKGGGSAVRNIGRSAISKNPRAPVSEMERLESMLPNESSTSGFRERVSRSVKKMRGGGMVKKMRGGGMVKKMRGGGMVQKMRGGGAVKKK